RSLGCRQSNAPGTGHSLAPAPGQSLDEPAAEQASRTYAAGLTMWISSARTESLGGAAIDHPALRSRIGDLDGFRRGGKPDRVRGHPRYWARPTEPYSSHPRYGALVALVASKRSEMSTEVAC